MEKILMNNELKDDFAVKSIMTTELEKTDEDYDVRRPYVTHGLAVRPDGATLTFICQHGTHHPLAPGLIGAEKVGELKIGFYLRKPAITTESKIIQIGTQHKN